MSWLGDRLDDVGRTLEDIGRTIAPRDTAIGKAVRTGFNAAVAPYQLAGDVLKGKNIFESVGNRSIQAFAPHAGIGLQLGISSDIGKSVTRVASPFTLGLTDRFQGFADTTIKAGVQRPDEALSIKEQTLYARDAAYVGATAIGAATVFGAGPLAGTPASPPGLGAAGGELDGVAASKGAFSGAGEFFAGASGLATPALLVANVLKGKGSLASLSGLIGLDPDMLAFGDSFYDGYKSAGGPISSPDPVGTGSEFIAAPAPAKAAISPVIVVGGVLALVALVATAGRRA